MTPFLELINTFFIHILYIILQLTASEIYFLLYKYINNSCFTVIMYYDLFDTCVLYNSVTTIFKNISVQNSKHLHPVCITK